MKVVILYRPRSEQASSVEMFIREYQTRYIASIEIVHVDDREGIALASLYDIMSFPAILVLAQDGSLLQLWSNGQLPLMEEVASYARQ